MNDRTAPGEWFVLVSKHPRLHPQLSMVLLLEVTNRPATGGAYCTHQIDCDVMSGSDEKDDALIERMRKIAEAHNACAASERARWAELRAWVERSVNSYEQGALMSISESIHGASTMREVLAQMTKIEGPTHEMRGLRSKSRSIE